ncbi:uncharacterized protein At4g18490 isoform X2 [Brassica rapa]|uniref:uncharacterized protein At4g18490-like isoform X2 n=1 Tax=Brassica napus TaxID=3708 RepID=UPI000872A238|nr:uncharacterized protein At4g18490-like isoform X2 [Brassica napus]XP_018512669.1 uncharacterized protein At4g18490 isoform X2 [Brassica rapa]
MSPPAKKSSTEAKEKDLILDNDMEKDTWSFKSMADDPMDFAFGSPANKKKNAFKLDMGFDFDGDFGNSSSFKMDMPDFDFSSPAKKTTKAKESPGDKSSGDLKQKKNPFHFSYDFDALDDFNLDSSPPKKGTKTTTKVMDFEEIDKSGSLDFGHDSPITRQAASVSNTDVKEKASAEKENLNSKTTDTMVVESSAHSKQATEERMENSEAVESPQGLRIKTSTTHTMCLQPQSVDASPLKTSCVMLEDTDDPCLSNETAAPSPLHASETTHTAANREISPDINEICRSSSKEDSPRDPEQNANKDMISAMDTSYEKAEQTKPSISSQLCLDKMDWQQEEMGIGTQAEKQDHTRRTSSDPDHGHPQTTLSGKISPSSRQSQAAQVQDSSGKLPLDTSHSVPGLSDLKITQNKDSGLIRSKFFKKTEKPQSHVLKSSLTQTESRPVTREKIAVNMNLTNDRRHDIQDVLPGSKTRTCPVELVKTDSEIANVNSIRSHKKIIHKDHSNVKTAENVAAQLDHLKMQSKNTTREKSILQINISSKLDASSLTQKLSKNLSSGAESLQKSKLVSLERPKLGNMMFDLLSAKTQRTIGVTKDQSSSFVQPVVNSTTGKERNTEASVKRGSETHHLAPRDKTQLLDYPSSLKRKALDEDADRSLKPQLKRFSMSPRENRNAEDLTHRVAQGKFSSQESRIDNNTTKELVGKSPRSTSHHQMGNMANLEIPVTENSDNIEKAEAYTKELESICNTLKKKHEEAKELLVRAIVNNNKLLMLNHPLHEDKIRMIQKFAAKLSLRDTQTTTVA